jgi:hypothetical protein
VFAARDSLEKLRQRLPPVLDELLEDGSAKLLLGGIVVE